jgi:hypothetical protein
MSTIIDFPAGGKSKASKRPEGSQAEVIIFPGVRIERREFNIADRITTVRRRPALPNQAEDFDHG